MNTGKTVTRQTDLEIIAQRLMIKVEKQMLACRVKRGQAYKKLNDKRIV